MAAQPPDDPRRALRDLPEPNLEAQEAAVRRQLQAEREELDRLLADASAEERVAAAAASLASLYYLYDLPELALRCLDPAVRMQPGRVDWRHLRGVILVAQGRPDEAMEDFDAVVEADPRNVAAWVRRGRLLFDRAAYGEAADSFRRALARDGESASALGGLGRTEIALGQPGDAVDHLRRALALRPEATSLYYSLGRALRELGEVEAAREALARHGHGRLPVEDPLLDRIRSRNVSAEALLHDGNRALAAGRASEAAELLERFVEARADDPRGRYGLARAHLAVGRADRAVEVLRGLLELEPEHLEGLTLLAETLAGRGDHAGAAELYERAHELAPDDLHTLADWAATLANLGEVDRGLRRLEEVAAPSGDAAYAQLKLAGILRVTGDRDRARSLYEELGRAVEVDPEVRAEAFHQLARLHLEANRPGDARTSLEAALEAHSDHLPALQLLGRVLGRLRELDEAAEVFRRVVVAAPRNQEARLGLAMSLLLDGREAEARVSLEEALAEMPEDPALTNVLARVLAASEDPAVRDGARAVVLARDLVRREPGPEVASTLAMALAEQGQFEQAARLQRQVLDRANAAGAPTEQLDTLRRRLELFRNGRAERSPWRP